MKKLFKVVLAGLMLVGIGNAFAQGGPQGGVSWKSVNSFVVDDDITQDDLVWYSTADDLN